MNGLRIAGYAALFGVADAGRDTIHMGPTGRHSRPIPPPPLITLA